ncbi:unnamed protein product [Ambrosiozyma monospora]|uniref:Unnamed protein product n=1 Tax=Ambrosiozyma monospora TaxID=43982 RepID=A0ACB5TFF3_AMBMO|nr:unnamed protein product [Ambrosiozyma monospora]
MCEQCNDLSEFVELLEGGYSSAIAKATLSEFESELFEVLTSSNNMFEGPKGPSPFSPFTLIFGFHFAYVAEDPTHWVHLKNWLIVLLRLVRALPFVDETDLWYMIKCLTLSVKAHGASTSGFETTVNDIVALVEELIVFMGFSFIGNEMRGHFIKSIPLLNGLANPDIASYKKHLIGSPVTIQLSVQLEKLFKDQDAIERNIRRHENCVLMHQPEPDTHQEFLQLSSELEGDFNIPVDVEDVQDTSPISIPF